SSRLWLNISDDSLSISKYDSFRVFLKNNNNTFSLHEEDVKIIKENIFELDMAEFYETYGFKRGRWAFYFLVETANYREEIRVGAFHLPSLLKHQRYYEQVDVNKYDIITLYLFDIII